MMKSRAGLREDESDWSDSEFLSSEEEDNVNVEPDIASLLALTHNQLTSHCVMRSQHATMDTEKEHKSERCIPCMMSSVFPAEDPFLHVHASLIPRSLRTSAQRKQLRREKADKLKKDAEDLKKAQAKAKKLASQTSEQVKTENPSKDCKKSLGDGKKKRMSTKDEVQKLAADMNISLNQARDLRSENIKALKLLAKAANKSDGENKTPVAKNMQDSSRCNRYPGRNSILTRDEQERMVAMMANLSNHNKLRFKDQGDEYKALVTRLTLERKRFVDFVKQEKAKQHVANLAQGKNKGNPLFHFMPTQINQFLQGRMVRSSNELLTDLSHRNIMNSSFCLMQQFDPTTVTPIECGPNVITMNTPLLDIGKPSKMILPDLKVRAQVDMQGNNVRKAYPDNLITMLSESVHSGDETTSLLVRKHDLDVAMSASTARLLICGGGPGRGTDFDVPIQVVSYVSNGKMVKRVHILKALPPRNQTVMNRLWTFHKYALRTKLINHKFDMEKARSYSRKRQPAFRVDEEEEGVYDAALETFGTQTFMSPRKPAANRSQDASTESVTTKASAKEPPSDEKRVTRANSSKSDSETVVKNEPEAPQKKTELRKRVSDKNEHVTDVLDSIIGEENEDEVAQTAEFVEDPMAYTAPSKPGVHYVYTKWTLGEHSILIRAKAHAMLRSTIFNAQVRASTAVKVEYLPEHGAQVLSEMEQLYHWCTAVLQQSRHHIVARVHFQEGHILHLANVNVTSDYVKKPSKLVTSGMARLNKILCEVKQLRTGNYLMRQTSNSNIIILEDSQGKMGPVVNVNECYDARGEWQSSLAPLPPFDTIYEPPDPNILLQWHKIKKSIPCTFPFRRDNQPARLNAPKSQKRNSRKRNKAQEGEDRNMEDTLSASDISMSHTQ